MTRPRPPRPRAAEPKSAAPKLAWADPRGPYLLPLLLLLACRAWIVGAIPFAGEDAYITFRYAWNLAHGAGAVFNAGERVFGYTSPPWMAWLALGIRLGLEPIAWSRVSLLVADAVTLLALVSLLDRHASRAAAWCFGVFFAAWPYFGALAASGLEMSAMLALLAGTAWLAERRHPAAGVALGLLAVFRPEGLLAALALAFWASRRDRLVALGIMAATALALTLFYGSPVPQSVLAKAGVYGAPGPLRAPQWWDWTFPMPLWNGLATTSEGKNFFLLSILVTPAAVAGAMFLWTKRATALAGAVAAGLVVWLAYLAVGTTWFFWYFSTPLLTWIVLACAGLPRIVNGRLVYAAAILAIAGHWTFEPRLYSARAFLEDGAFGSMGDFIASHARPGETVMLEPIGTIGWRARELRVVDEVGLVTPALSARRRQGPGWYADALASRRPEWLVVRGGMLRSGEAFVGTGAPFRDAAERLAAFAAYDTAALADTTTGPQNFVVLRRRAGR